MLTSRVRSSRCPGSVENSHDHLCGLTRLENLYRGQSRRITQLKRPSAEHAMALAGLAVRNDHLGVAAVAAVGHHLPAGQLLVDAAAAIDDGVVAVAGLRVAQ